MQDHTGEFGLVALFNADAKVIEKLPPASDIHIIHPFMKLVKLSITREDGTTQPIELSVIQACEPETVYLNLVSLAGSAAPSEFATRVFAN